MRKPFFVAVACFAALLLPAACAKTKSSSGGSAALTIVNAVNGSNALVTNFSGTDSIGFYATAAQIPLGSYVEIGSYTGATPLWLYNYPDTTVQDAPLYKLTFQLPVGSIHSLFLMGSTSAPDTLFTTDVLSAYTDSVFGVRLVNLVTGTSGYKTLSPFTTYASNAESTSLTLYFTDPATGDTLNTFTLTGNGMGWSDPNNGNTLTFKNVTIALYGTVGSTMTMLIDDY